MRSIDKYLELLNQLSPESKPKWGIMTSQHMVEHLIQAVKMSNGKLKLKCYNQNEKIPTLRRFLMGNRPLPQLFINPAIGEGLLPLEFVDINNALVTLKDEVDDYYSFFKVHFFLLPIFLKG